MKKRNWRRKAVAFALCGGVLLTGTSVAYAASGNSLSGLFELKTEKGEERSESKLMPIEDYLKDCWAKKQEVIDVSPYKITYSELNKIIFGIHYEEPEYYWTIHRSAFDENKETGFVDTYYQYYEGETGRPFDRKEELEREWEIVQEKTKYCKTDLEKALVVHEHLCNTIHYTAELGVRAHDIEGGILEKKAVCEGYALAYKYYMNRLGIPCKVVSGVTQGMSHAWNQIQLNGKWYFVDVTWDDSSSPIREAQHVVEHDYFIASENLYRDHIWNKESGQFEICDDTTYDHVEWRSDLKNMCAYQGGLYSAKTRIQDGKVSWGIFRYDAEDVNKPAELVVDLKDQFWQVDEDNKGPGYSEISCYEGMLYYNTPKAVWRWNFDKNTAPEKVFELDEKTKGEIWYLKVADGKIYYETGIYYDGVREKNVYTVDKNYKKAKHPIAVTRPVMVVKMGEKTPILQSAAPGVVTYTSKNPEICDVKPAYLDESCELIPKKPGETTVIVHADATDHYLEGSVEVKIIVKGDTDVEEVLKGDVNFDGKVDIMDTRIITKHVCKQKELTEEQKKAADVTADGKVDIKDLRKILRFVCGKVDKL